MIVCVFVLVQHCS